MRLPPPQADAVVRHKEWGAMTRSRVLGICLIVCAYISLIPSGFTAAINAELPVGSLEETITVTGESPLVDTQNVRKQTILSAELLDLLPTSTKNWATIVQVTPGFSGSFADVAGQLNQNIGNAYHGKTGTKRQFDGMSIDHAGTSGTSSTRT
jgi:hypothetical protein